METNDSLTKILTLIRETKQECVKAQFYDYAGKLRDLQYEIEQHKLEQKKKGHLGTK